MKTAMSCQDFDRRLDALIDAACAEDEWREAEVHLARCPRCRALFEGAAGRGAILDEGGQASLTAAVIRRTAGDPCASARGRLCDFVDGTLDPFDRGLVAGHLSHCAPCAALAEALARSTLALPSFAVIEPPEPLVAGVLAATSRRPVQPSVGERVSAWLGRAALRPRFSLEVAYVCTLLLALVFGNPVRAFKETAARGAALAQPRVEMAVERIAKPLAAARATAGTVVNGTVERFAAADRGAESLGAFQAAGRWWDTNVVRRVRSMLGAAADWLRAAQQAANELAVTLLGGERRDAAAPGGEPPAAPAR